MSRRVFFENFALFTDAPNGVTKLRELVLQLAVQGKLVQQDSNEESSAEFLKTISSGESGSKNGASRVSITSEGKCQPFDLPTGWEWCRLADFGISRTGTTPATSKAEYYGTDYPLIKPADITPDGINYRKAGLSKLGLEVGRLVPAVSVLMVSIGGSIGKVGIVDRDCSCNQQINYITLNNKIVPKLFYYFLKSPYFQEQVISRAPQTTLPILSKGKWDVIPLPLPPFEQQKRILTRVEELMRLCDEMEALQQAKRESRVRLNTAILAPLHKAASLDSEELALATTRVAHNFDMLYDSIDTLSKLRATILQLAVQGKLVPQEPSDEPASILLEEIKKTRAKSDNDKKGKNTARLRAIEDDGAPFALPCGWRWSRFVDIATIASNLVQPCDYLDYPHVAPDNIEKFTGRLLPYRTVREDKVSSSNHKFFEGQIVYSKIRPNLAKAVIVDFEGLCSADMYPINSHIYSPFLLHYMLSDTFLSMAVKTDTRVAMPKINQEELNGILVPVPPLAEQKRIVAKVNQLMSLCDELEGKLRQAEADSEKLMNAAVKHVLESVRDVSKTEEEVFA